MIFCQNSASQSYLSFEKLERHKYGYFSNLLTISHHIYDLTFLLSQEVNWEQKQFQKWKVKTQDFLEFEFLESEDGSEKLFMHSSSHFSADKIGWNAGFCQVNLRR